MSIRRRSLLARIEGELARLAVTTADRAGIHWQRIEWAGKAMAPLLLTPEEQQRFRNLLAELKSLRKLNPDTPQFLHHATLLRADCVIWQLSLVQHQRGVRVIPSGG